MSIELHCPQCQKLIRAPDNVGGKRGKCPYCGASVYVPTLPDESEEIGLAPVNEQEEHRARKLRREAAQYAAAVDHVTDAGNDGPDVAETPGNVVDVGGDVEIFIIAMRDSKLDEADAATKRLKRSSARARDYIQGLLADEIPPAFENVPQPVVQGFLKALLGRLK
jgi:hypothetical protein